MKKKLMGMLLATIMLLGASMTAFATDVNTEFDGDVSANKGQTITMDSKVAKAIIKVTITNGSQVVANPYGLSGQVSGVTVSGGETLKGTTIKFENKSNTSISLALGGKITIDKDSKVSVVGKETDATNNTGKKVYVEAKITAGDTDGLGKRLVKLTTTGSGSSMQYKPDYEAASVYSTAGVTMPKVVLAQGVDGQNNPASGAGVNTQAFAGLTASDYRVTDTAIVTITGASGLSQTEPWTAKDTFKVVTTYNIKLGGSDKLSLFK